MLLVKDLDGLLQRAYGVRTVQIRTLLTSWKSVYMDHFPCVKFCHYHYTTVAVCPLFSMRHRKLRNKEVWLPAEDFEAVC